MLLLPESVYDARERLWRDSKAGKIADDVLYPKLLELDPDDFIALTGVGLMREEAGDVAGAEEYYWRALRSNPCASAPYFALVRLLVGQPESQALATGLFELGLLKKSREEDADAFLSAFDYEKAGFEGELLDQFQALPAAGRAEAIARSLRENRTDEPAPVTDRLRPLRLIERMQREVALEAETVDAIIAEGPAIVPLLIGVIRAWAQDCLDEEGDDYLESSLALLGEIGSPPDIEHLLEFVDLENEMASGPASWAFGRMIDRFPAESAKFIGSIVPSLGLPGRLTVAEMIVRHQGFDPQGKLFERLGEDLAPMEKSERDRFFPLLVGAMAARGREGLNMARAAFRRQGGLLSRSARRECEDLLDLFTGQAMQPRPPEPSAPTVYEICLGEVDWAEELGNGDEMEDEMEDDFVPPPEPVRRRVVPGRNDPCWCNSGKKYKKCHLDSDERENRQTPHAEEALPHGTNEFTRLRKDIGEFLGQVLPLRETRQGLEEFFGDGPNDDMEQIPFIDWMIHDKVSPSLGRTVLEEFLKRRPRLTAREREMVEAWSRSYVGLYEVQQLKAGVGGELKDLILGGTFFVHDVSLSKNLAKWDGILGRVVPGERGTELAGSVLTVPRTQLPHFREWLGDDRAESGLDWPEYLKGNWPRIRLQTAVIAANWLASLRLSNTDGEELLFSKSTWRMIDEVVVIGALQLCPEFRNDSGEDEQGMRFVWLDEKETVLGSIHVGNGELILEANSRQRVERGKRLLTDLVGGALKHVRDEFTTQKDLKRRMSEGPGDPQPAGADIPKEVRDEIITKAMERHYSRWVDTQLPALNGKTPRQAVKTSAGRETVAALLKDFENGEDRKRQAGEPFFDFARLRAELGLDG